MVVEYAAMQMAFDNAGESGIELGWIIKLESTEHAYTDEDLMQTSVAFKSQNDTVKCLFYWVRSKN